MKDDLKEYGSPRVLAVGDSHMPRLDTFLKDPHTPDKYCKMLPNLHCTAVGGAKWWNCDDLLNGIGLPPHKSHLANQWNNLITTDFKAEVILLSLGGNDADDAENMANQLYKAHFKDPRVRRLFKSRLDDWFEQLTPKIEFLQILTDRVPGIKIRYIAPYI